MAEPFLGQITIVGFNFAPRGFAFCDGQLLPINQNQALYSLLGTTYGGDGRTTFALPDLRGRTPIHTGGSDGTQHQLGQKGGEEAVTLTIAEMAQHAHQAHASNDDAVTVAPGANLLARALNLYVPPASTVELLPATVGNAGGSQPHENMQPYLAINFCIALRGLFPSRN